MESSRTFWISFVIFGVSILISSIVRFLGDNRSLPVLALGISGLAIALIGIYGTLQPEKAGGPSSGSPLTYGAIIAAVLFAASTVLELV